MTKLNRNPADRNTATLPARDPATLPNASAEARDRQFDPATRPNSGADVPERNDYRDGFVHGRTQSMRDSEHLASYFVARDRSAATRGLLLGLSLAALVGGAIAALVYFELRLDSIAPSESPIQIVPPIEPESPPESTVEEDIPTIEDLSPSEAPAENLAPIIVPPTDEAPSEVTPGDTPSDNVAPREEAPAPEASEQSSLSNDIPLGLPPMGGPYTSEGEDLPADAGIQSAPESPVSESPVSVPVTAIAT